MKKFVQNNIFFFATVFTLGGIVALAYVSNCGAPCTFLAQQAQDLSGELIKARADLKAAEQISQTQIQ